jgi:HSP20 family protein
MTLVKFNNKRNNALMPGFNDVFESIFNDTFFNDRMVTRVPAVNISETENSFEIILSCSTIVYRRVNYPKKCRINS